MPSSLVTIMIGRSPEIRSPPPSISIAPVREIRKKKREEGKKLLELLIISERLNLIMTTPPLTLIYTPFRKL